MGAPQSSDSRPQSIMTHCFDDRGVGVPIHANRRMSPRLSSYIQPAPTLGIILRAGLSPVADSLTGPAPASPGLHWPRGLSRSRRVSLCGTSRLYSLSEVPARGFSPPLSRPSPAHTPPARSRLFVPSSCGCTLSRSCSPTCGCTTLVRCCLHTSGVRLEDRELTLFFFFSRPPCLRLLPSGST